MNRQLLLVLPLAAIAAVTLAKYADQVAAWLEPEPPPRPIVFDNGSVREVPVVSRPPLAELSGLPKRCDKNGVITYTDRPCDRGAKAREVRGNVTVVEAVPSRPASSAATITGAHELRRALDIDGPTLRDRRAAAAANP